MEERKHYSNAAEAVGPINRRYNEELSETEFRERHGLLGFNPTPRVLQIAKEAEEFLKQTLKLLK